MKKIQFSLQQTRQALAAGKPTSWTRIFLAATLAGIVVSQPALADSLWASSLGTFGDNIYEGIRTLFRTVAGITLSILVFRVWTGNAEWRELWKWFVGVGVVFGLGEIIGLIPAS